MSHVGVGTIEFIADASEDQTLITLEAMKMEHNLVAPFDGTVADLSAVEAGR